MPVRVTDLLLAEAPMPKYAVEHGSQDAELAELDRMFDDTGLYATKWKKPFAKVDDYRWRQEEAQAKAARNMEHTPMHKDSIAQLSAKAQELREREAALKREQEELEEMKRRTAEAVLDSRERDLAEQQDRLARQRALLAQKTTPQGLPTAGGFVVMRK